MTSTSINWIADTFGDSFGSIWTQERPYDANVDYAFDLYTATTFGDYEYIKKLIIGKKVEDLNKKNHGCWTALMYAVYYGHSSILDLLLHHGASLHICNAKGINCLMLAARCGNETFVKYLIKAGSLLEARDKDDWTALHHAIYSADFNVVQTLLELGANPNACDRRTSKTPIMFAALLGDVSIVEILLKNGARAEMKTNTGQTAAMFAQNGGHPLVVTLINRWSMEERIMQPLMVGPESIEAKSIFLNPRRPFEVPRQTESVASGIVTNLDALLKKLGLSAFQGLFQREQVDFTTFLSLTEQDLKDCGVTKIGPRLRMLAGIERWHSNAPLTSGSEVAYANKLAIELRLSKAENEASSAAMKEAQSFQIEARNRLKMAEMQVMEGRSQLLEISERAETLRSHLMYTRRLVSTFGVDPPLEDATASCYTQMDQLVRVIESCLFQYQSSTRPAAPQLLL